VEQEKKRRGKTSANLLKAACDIFSLKGYRDATIAEICAQAGANIAAVNYHFGDKETLYHEAWRYAFLESIEAHPVHGGVGEHAPAEERLRGHIMSLVRRAADKNNKSFTIMRHEFAMPTGLLDEAVRDTIQPLHREFESIIRQIVGQSATDTEVRFYAISVLSQCTTPLLVKRAAQEGPDRKDPWPYIRDAEAYAEHVAVFSLKAIRALQNGPGENPAQGVPPAPKK
jgi:AcrR family transcriptional regulator